MKQKTEIVSANISSEFLGWNRAKKTLMPVQGSRFRVSWFMDLSFNLSLSLWGKFWLFLIVKQYVLIVCMNQIVLVGSIAIFICSVCYKFSTLYQKKLIKDVVKLLIIVTILIVTMIMMRMTAAMTILMMINLNKQASIDGSIDWIQMNPWYQNNARGKKTEDSTPGGMELQYLLLWWGRCYSTANRVCWYYSNGRRRRMEPQGHYSIK